MPPSGSPLGTTTVDLARPIEAVEQGYRRTLRLEISRARKRGVRVEQGGAGDLDDFWQTHLKLCRRRGVVSNVPGLNFVRQAWAELERRGRAWLFNARLSEEVLCSLICLGAGRWFYAWRIGWGSEAKRVFPTQATYGHAIRVAAEASYHYFDFMETFPDEAERLARGEVVDSPTAGITFFKMGFGGALTRLPPTLDYFPNPAVRVFMRTIGVRLLSSGQLLKYVRRLR